MKIIPGGAADKAGIKCGINPSTVGLDKITDEDIQDALNRATQTCKELGEARKISLEVWHTPMNI